MNILKSLIYWSAILIVSGLGSALIYQLVVLNLAEGHYDILPNILLISLDIIVLLGLTYAKRN
jgi:hypothetical protein